MAQAQQSSASGALLGKFKMAQQTQPTSGVWSVQNFKFR